MKGKSEKVKEIIEFRDCDKFEVYQHLQPAVSNSTEEDKKSINEIIDDCCNKVIQNLNNPESAEHNVKKIIWDTRDMVKDKMFDTEDTEFCYELFYKLGEILEIDVVDRSKSIEQALFEDMEKILKQAGLNLKDYLK